MSMVRNRHGHSGPHQNSEYGAWRPSRSRRGRRHSASQNTCQGALCATILGIVFIIGSAYFQFTTEQDYITRSKDIAQIQNTVKDPSSYFQRIGTNDPIFITETLHRPVDSKAPTDPITGVSHNGFVIRREIEMYQWEQQKHKETQRSRDHTEERDVTTYSYTKHWSSSYHNSGQFRYPEGHYNPQDGLFMSTQGVDNAIWSNKISLGKHQISSRRLGLLLEDTAATSTLWKDISSTVYDRYFMTDGFEEWEMKHSYIYNTNRDLRSSARSEVTDRFEPNVGDLRMRYWVLDLEGIDATFLGAFDGMKRLNVYVTPSGNEYIYLKIGARNTVKDVIDWFHSENSNTLWLWRGLTLLFMCLGFVCTSSIVTYIASWIPICGGLIGCGVNCAAMLLGVVVYGVFFVIAYFSARKEIAIALIVAVLLGLVFVQSGSVKKAEDRERQEGETKTE